MSSIRAAVKTIASFILHFLDTNCQGLDNTEGVKSDENVSNSFCGDGWCNTATFVRMRFCHQTNGVFQTM